jgi:hypothetical protein
VGAEQHSKLEIARIQIEAAVVHYEADEFIPAITLAGAGEEILGKMVKATGKKHALATAQDQTAVIYGLLWPGEVSDPKKVASAANAARNEMKHHDSGEDSSIELDPRAEAENMLDRAIENYFLLTQDQTPVMMRYLNRQAA